MNCRENRYFFLAPRPHPIPRGRVRDEKFKVTKRQVLTISRDSYNERLQCKYSGRSWVIRGREGG